MLNSKTMLSKEMPAEQSKSKANMSRNSDIINRLLQDKPSVEQYANMREALNGTKADTVTHSRRIREAEGILIHKLIPLQSFGEILNTKCTIIST